MAKVIGPLYSMEAHGAIRNAIIYRKNRKTNIVYGYRVRKKRITPWQKIIRNIAHITKKI